MSAATSAAMVAKILLVGCLLAAPAAAWPSAELADDIAMSILDEYEEFGPVRYRASTFDLNSDGRPETLVYLVGPSICGTGGCNLLIFTPESSGHRELAEIPLTKTPIRVARSSSAGWRDLIVHIGGGGVVSREARIPFAGATYAEESFAASERDLAEAEILIDTFQFEGADLLTRPVSPAK